MHSLPRVPLPEITSRLVKLQEHLVQESIDGALITQNVGIYYFTGTMQNGLLFVPASGEPCFYVKKSVERARFESDVTVEEMGRMKELGTKIGSRFGEVKRVGLELDVLPYNLAMRYGSFFPGAQTIDVSTSLRHLRAVKSSYEIQQIEKAASHIDGIFRALPQMIQEGMPELELVAEIEYRLRVQGNMNLYRMRGYNQELSLGMVASGAAAATSTYFDGPAGGIGISTAHPQGASQERIKRDQPILVDISTVVEGYMVDQTRLAVIGQLDEDLVAAYNVARQILKEVEKLGRPGTSWESLYLRALEIVEEHQLTRYFMGYGKDQARFLGHGLGLELDELPILAKGFSHPLETGMVIAIEPKFTFPGRGVIGLENTYVVEEGGLRSISISPEEIIWL